MLSTLIYRSISFLLFDLNMPGMDGKEVLHEIRGIPEVRKIPVIVLTSSSDERDVASCYGADEPVSPSL